MNFEGILKYKNKLINNYLSIFKNKNKLPNSNQNLLEITINIECFDEFWN